MVTNLVDLSMARAAASDDLAGLEAYLAQLLGEPFRLARVSYGDELTLHFGDMRPARSTKLGQQMYGAYILGLRGSPWLLKSGLDPLILTAGEWAHSIQAACGKPLRKEELESGRFIAPESRVLEAAPFVVKPTNGFGLQLRISDGSALLVLPTVSDPDESGHEELPRLADWELLSPRGLLSAWPNLQWSFEPFANG